MLDMFKKKFAVAFSSRKAWAAVIGAAIAGFGNELGLSDESIARLTQLAMTYIIGQGIADLGK